MDKRTHVFITLCISISLCMLSYNSANAYSGRKVGGRTQVPDVETNKEIQELGKFCVKEFNRQQQQNLRRGGGEKGRELEFSEVVEAERQVVAGIKYYMKIVVTTKNGESLMYDSVLVVKPWLHQKQLLNFRPSANLIVRRK